MSESMGGIISECPGDFVGIRIPYRAGHRSQDWGEVSAQLYPRQGIRTDLLDLLN
jgi:hypothetical protein